MDKTGTYSRRGIIKFEKYGLIRVLPFAFLLFRFYFSGISKVVQLGAVVAGLGLYLIANIKRTGSNFTTFLKGSIVFFTFLVISAAYPFFMGTGDYSYARLLMPYFIDLGSWAAFAIYCDKHIHERKNAEVVLAEEFGKIAGLYITFTILCMVISPLREFVIQHSSMDEVIVYNLRYEKYLARVGWDGFAGYKATFMCTLGVFFSLASISSTKDRTHKKHAYINIAVMFLGNTFYGRTGLVVSTVLIIIFVCKEMAAKGKIRTLLRTILVLSLLLIIYAAFAQFNASLKFIFDWAFEPIINYIHGNGFTTTSSSNWATMWAREFEIETLLHGDGRYTLADGHYYMRTDIGIYRMIFMWGIPMMLLYYFFALREYTKTLLYRISRFSLIYVFVIFLLFEIKGEITRNLYAIFIGLTLLRDNAVKVNWNAGKYWNEKNKRIDEHIQ